jgi:hypothetical protein
VVGAGGRVGLVLLGGAAKLPHARRASRGAGPVHMLFAGRPLSVGQSSPLGQGLRSAPLARPAGLGLDALGQHRLLTSLLMQSRSRASFAQR